MHAARGWLLVLASGSIMLVLPPASMVNNTVIVRCNSFITQISPSYEETQREMQRTRLWFLTTQEFRSRSSHYSFIQLSIKYCGSRGALEVFWCFLEKYNEAHYGECLNKVLMGLLFGLFLSTISFLHFPMSISALNQLSDMTSRYKLVTNGWRLILILVITLQ